MTLPTPPRQFGARVKPIRLIEMRRDQSPAETTADALAVRRALWDVLVALRLLRWRRRRLARTLTTHDVPDFAVRHRGVTTHEDT